MTTGSKVEDRTYAAATNKIIYPGGIVVFSGTANIGHKISKTWSGTDSTPVKPPKETWYWRAPDYYVVKRDPVTHLLKSTLVRGRLYRSKRRLDIRKRRLTTDHPYACSIQIQNDSLFTTRRMEYGSLTETTVESNRANWGEGYSSFTDSWSANDTLKLQEKLRTKIAGSGFNAGVFLGEGRKTLEMITDNATKIRRALTAAKKGSFVDAFRILGNASKPGSKAQDISYLKSARENYLAKNWLQVQYGVIPLLKDVEDGAQYLARKLDFPFEQSYTVRSKKNHKLAYVSTSIGEIDNGNFAFTRGKLIARLSEVDEITLSGLTDPLSIAWELMPYSFIADWFIPLGSYLQNRALARSLQGVFVFTTTRHVRCRVRGVVGISNPTVFKTVSAPYWALSESITMDRSVSTTLQVPYPQFKRLSEVPSWKRATNAIALLTLLHGSIRGK